MSSLVRRVALVLDCYNVWPSEILFAARPARLAFLAAVSLITLALLARCSDPYADIANLDSDGKTIVCFGDSITAGYGVEPEQAFPALIADRLEIQVINAGRSGDTTSDALARIETDVLAHDPRAVLVEFGGNDFRKKIDKADTLKNLDRIVERLTRHGTMVVVMEIRIGLFRGKYYDGYKDIVTTHDALMIPNFMAGILGNHKLTSDGIHPNSRGQELIAERVVERLVPLLRQADRIQATKQ